MTLPYIDTHNLETTKLWETREKAKGKYARKLMDIADSLALTFVNVKAFPSQMIRDFKKSTNLDPWNPEDDYSDQIFDFICQAIYDQHVKRYKSSSYVDTAFRIMLDYWNNDEIREWNRNRENGIIDKKYEALMPKGGRAQKSGTMFSRIRFN